MEIGGLCLKTGIYINIVLVQLLSKIIEQINLSPAEF